MNADPLAPARSRADWEAQGWAAESEPIAAAPRLETTISIRFDPEGAALLRQAARLKGLTKSQFVRQATLQAARNAIAASPTAATMRVVRQAEVAVTKGSGISTRASSPTTTTRRVIELTT